MIPLGKVIRMAREARGMTQTDLATMIRCDPSYVSLVDTGKRIPSLETLTALARVLDIPLSLVFAVSEGWSSTTAESWGRWVLAAMVRQATGEIVG